MILERLGKLSNEGHGFSRAERACALDGFKPLRYGFRDFRAQSTLSASEFATTIGKTYLRG
jgi:hypothetical protein